MCIRRDEQGRLVKGARLNPAGRSASARIARLVRDAEALGATVTITLPTTRTASDAPPPSEAA